MADILSAKKMIHCAILGIPKATITRCDLSATIIFKLVDSYLIAFKFAQ